jgi:flagellar basal-body rod protein FlgB
MGSEGIFSGTVSLVEQALHVRSKKHGVVASNIANIDTPHYKAFDVIVQEEMEKIAGDRQSPGFKRTQPGHLPARAEAGSVVPKRVETLQTGMRKDGNTVDLDKSMAALSENTILYTALAQIAAKKFEGLKSVINEGK